MLKNKLIMKAMIIQQYGGPEQLAFRELPVPQAADGDILIRVKAFGINHAEIFMRQGAWGNVAPVSGIECVGEVVNDTTGRLREGARVAAILGGMGRTRNGSYAEYTVAPATNVIPLESSLSWTHLAAIPESYVTAWCCLFDRHRLQKNQVLLVRGATSALGQAAINLAVQAGATVIAATRSEAKKNLLQSLGAASVLIENYELAPQIRKIHPDGIDYVLDLVGNRTVHDSLKTAGKGGRVVMAGFLGGHEPVSFDVISSLPTGVDLTFFGSAFVLGNQDYPFSGIPLQKMVHDAEKGVYRTKPVRVFDFEQIPDAHRLMESSEANGKIVVQV
jgi:NADPH:quinone reductase-like Zn-dependent oxidoreductase